MLTFVLDTNVVLEWLVFNESSLLEFTYAVKAGRVHVLTHDGVRDELRRVLNYPALKLHTTRQDEVYRVYESLCQEATVPTGFNAQNLLLPDGFPDCRDPDDQLFLALALHTNADALVSRDRAVLALRKKARKFGVVILDLEQLRESFPVRC
jgi:putative PIN family toxin of toxin-antitoxin system